MSDRSTNATTHEIEPTYVYRLAGIDYVPHYLKAHVYVGPGGREFQESYFVMFKAQKIKLLLWPRHHCL